MDKTARMNLLGIETDEDRIYKLALTIMDARKAVSAYKRTGGLIRRDITPQVKAKLPAAISSKLPKSIGPLGTFPKKIDPKIYPYISKGLPNLPGGKTYAKGSSLKPFTELGWQPGPVKIRKREKEMLNRLMLLHEQAEQQALRKAKGFSMWSANHADPSVILRESNMLASLPKKKYKGVKNFFKEIREIDNTKTILEKNIPGFKYGETKISRHGIRNIQRALKRKGGGPEDINAYERTARLSAVLNPF